MKKLLLAIALAGCFSALYAETIVWPSCEYYESYYGIAEISGPSMGSLYLQGLKFKFNAFIGEETGIDLSINVHLPLSAAKEGEDWRGATGISSYIGFGYNFSLSPGFSLIASTGLAAEGQMFYASYPATLGSMRGIPVLTFGIGARLAMLWEPWKGVGLVLGGSIIQYLINTPSGVADDYQMQGSLSWSLNAGISFRM